MISAELLAQYTALTSSVGVADLTGRTLIEVTGADRVQLLHSFTTADVKKLPVGQSCEAFVTSPQGKTLAHVWLTCLADSLLIDTVPGQAALLLAHFEKYIISEDATLREVTADEGELLLAGPQSSNLLKEIFIDDASTIIGRPQLAVAGAVLKRLNFLAAPSCFLETSRRDVPLLLAAVEQSGAMRCYPDAVEMARVEAGTPVFGKDITADNLPQEIGRDALAISFTKGCYLGQETVARIDALGHVNRQLAGVRFAGNSIPAAGTKLFVAEKEVGHVTSAVWSPKLAAPLAIALVRRAQTKPGTVLASESGVANVIELPV
jgi:tRNA-modifying protein YgfZ